MKRKMRFAGHVLRESAGNLANLILEGTIAGKISRGRQRTKWSDDIKEWSGTMPYAEAKREAEDRKRSVA